MENERIVTTVTLLAVAILSLAAVGGFLFTNEGEKRPDLGYSNLSLSAENSPIGSPPSFEFAEDKFYTGEINLSVEIANPKATIATENVELRIDDSPSEGNDGVLVDNKQVRIEPDKTETVDFVIFENVEDNYVARIDGASQSFSVLNPARDPALYPAHYYGVAEDYVPREYEIPENKEIKGLVEFLNQVEMPPYKSDSFKCTHSSAMLEWLLEGAGFDAEIAVDFPENKKEGKYRPEKWETGHVWVMVILENREIAIESELLGSSARVAQDWSLWYYTATTVPYEPPGTIETRDNYLRDNSIQLPDLISSYRPYYYDNVDKRYSSPKELKSDLEYVREQDYDWWNEALNYPGIKSKIYDVEPFSSWTRK